MKDSSSGLRAANWLQFPSVTRAVQNEEAVMDRLAAAVDGQIREGRYRRDDVTYIKSIRLSLPAADLSLSDKELERMRRLCQLWEVKLAPPQEIRSHRPIVGPLIVAVKKAIYPLLNFFLKDALRKQRDFNAAVVHFLLMKGAPEPRDNGPRTLHQK